MVILGNEYGRTLPLLYLTAGTLELWYIQRYRQAYRQTDRNILHSSMGRSKTLK